ncbi:Helicase-like transcription factor CHR27 [Vanrija pseudolonga]|uniref:Helicase-like transcription factor CHR27 n=1 Tax=Vanrija pseudolonga TaxID=143232 RepID=A0AAF0YG97_9TREE|nr:Helicase-like transcription factor CHR27 [Vanrija pseudolonga]
MTLAPPIDLTDLSDGEEAPAPAPRSSGGAAVGGAAGGADPSAHGPSGNGGRDLDFTITSSHGPTTPSPMMASTGSAAAGRFSNGFAASAGGPSGFGFGAAAASSTPRVPVVPSLPVFAGPSSVASSSAVGVPGGSSGGPTHAGTSQATAIDVDSVQIRNSNPKKPVCIGAFMSRAIMLYPTEAVVQGAQPPPGSRDPWEIVNFRGVEMIRVKLKLRRAGQPTRPDEPWSAVSRDVIQVMTPGMTTYIGDLDPAVSEVLISMLTRGLCRLEGFAMRLQPDGNMFEVRINVMVFTLPSNINYITATLVAHNLYLLDPMPPYDPNRHGEQPEYINAHGGGRRAYDLYMAAQRSHYGGGSSNFSLQQEKANLVEVQRQQVDEVFKNLENGQELEQSDPGPYIRTELFPHQRKALTFLLQGEQDWNSLKTARRAANKLFARVKKEKGEDAANGNEKERSESRDPKDDNSRSLWEPQMDDKGRPRVWKSKITGEKLRLKKGERPKDAKGAILADDMGLGKTLSVVSLIAATRPEATSWSRKPLEKFELIDGDDDCKEEIGASAMSTRVFGMPEDDSGGESSKKRKKRPREDEALVALRARRSTILKRSKATLLVCPMSTITNWEDQIKEHWDGEVEVIGGTSANVKKERGSKPAADEDELEGSEWDKLRVYIYHGTSRKADPRFLAEFDIVITSYSTLANEYSKQCATCGGDDESTPADTGVNSSDESGHVDSTRPASGSRSTKGDRESDIKPADIVEALRTSKKQPRRKLGATSEQRSPLQQIDWFRVVLDEAHSIKSSATVACKASCFLEADRRIALTGTPIQNRIEDVWALFKFLRLAPVDDKEVFNKYIISPCKTGDPVGIARLQLIMRACTLRRTKDSTADNGAKILNLPPRKEVQLWLDLREDERKIYDARLEEVKQEVHEMQAKKELTKNYAHVLQHLLRLRQTCNHTDLPSSGAVEEDYDGTIMEYDVAIQGIERHGLNLARAQSVLCFLKDTAEGAVCAECNKDYAPYFPSLGLGGAEEGPKPELVDKKGKKVQVRPILTKCMHIICYTCFKRSVWPQYPKGLKGVTRQCGVCDQMLHLDYDIIQVDPPNDDQDAAEPQPKKTTRRKYVRPPGERPSLSTKMQWLLDELMRFSKRNKHSDNYDPWFQGAGDDPDEIIELDDDGAPIAVKSVVFSQWTTMLDRIGDMLDEANIRYCRLDGTMTREERARAMEDLRTKKKIEVMLVSTRAGGVGLNLTSASRAYLVDPYWNPSVEAQAIDRIHRLGQKRPVTAIKLMINGSVEKKLSDIQQKKANLANLSLKNMSRQELMEQKAEELVELFS